MKGRGTEKTILPFKTILESTRIVSEQNDQNSRPFSTILTAIYTSIGVLIK